ncbi:MAG: hypothetical protein IKL79_01030 [Clostridia bacterium]|nr:hypothetical protein [Clostridia bacterium]MBR3680571.1 hypothetical protein [Clostridia bacterium]
MSTVNEGWAGYYLRLERTTSEYTYGDWYNHSWDEVFEIEEGADKVSRGERIRIDKLTEDGIYFTFFDEKATAGIEGVVSRESPRICLRGESAQGGRNEYAWSRSDSVVLTLKELRED